MVWFIPPADITLCFYTEDGIAAEGEILLVDSDIVQSINGVVVVYYTD